ncbi:MAG: hypothetical protein CM1200mP18_17790 [Gammaproteobacteria bacterium]|nr:MAG: hypothetical protein CM1200mP18_17790 [Gammaproteobacteria bacterium]
MPVAVAATDALQPDRPYICPGTAAHTLAGLRGGLKNRDDIAVYLLSRCVDVL